MATMVLLKETKMLLHVYMVGFNVYIWDGFVDRRIYQVAPPWLILGCCWVSRAI